MERYHVKDTRPLAEGINIYRNKKFERIIKDSKNDYITENDKASIIKHINIKGAGKNI